jgi:hypothetical protein
MIDHPLKIGPGEPPASLLPETLAITVAAINGTAIRRQGQATVRIAADKPGNGGVAVLFQGVILTGMDISKLLNIGKALPTDRILWVRRIHKRRIIGGDRKGINFGNPHPFITENAIPARQFGKVLRAAETVPILPTPISPLRR